VISCFHIIDDDGVLVLEGKVTDKEAPVDGLTVVFGGILAEYDLTCHVAANGTFTDGMTIPSGGIIGTATAQTTDCLGHVSNLAMGLISAS
jgi:hypothetical protein